jgi:hypothetical protein
LAAQGSIFSASLCTFSTAEVMNCPTG